MRLDIIKNMDSAPYMGASYGQDVEPKGTYVLEKPSGFSGNGKWVQGVAEINNPLIIDVTSENLIRYKYELAKNYKAKGQRLTKKLMDLGYDAIITQHSDGSKGEIILFPNSKYMLDTKGEVKEQIKQKLRESFVYEETTGGYVAYHGTNTQIQKFTDDFVGGKDANDQEGPGIYFTTSRTNARSYGPFIYNVKLKPKKIVSTKTNEDAPMKEINWLLKQAPDWESTAENWDENPTIGLQKAASDIIRYNDNPHQQFLQVWIDFYKYNPVEYVRNMTKLGYDAIVINNLQSMIANERNITHIIVLNPAIIEYIGMEDDRTPEEK